MPRIIYHYEHTIEKKYWENYLDRQLTQDEKIMFDDIRSEKRTNNRIKDVAKVAKEKGLYIPMLTQLKGNCFFETLQFHNITNDHSDLRKTVAYIMHVFRDFKEFFPDNSQLSLKELFIFQNEIGRVFDKKSNASHPYNYDTMCRDITSDTSWSRLPMELILTVIAYVFNLRLLILHDNGHTTVIESCPDFNTMNLNMVLLGEMHYVPLLPRTGAPHEDNMPKYHEALQEFHRWARFMAESTGRFDEINSDDDNNNKFVKKIKSDDAINLDKAKKIEIDPKNFVLF